MIKTPKILIYLFIINILTILFLLPDNLKAQTTSTTYQVTSIYSDFNGYWTASTTNPSSGNNRPNLYHNLLAFTWGGKTYSTGIDDDNLTQHNVNFTASNFNSFPINSVKLTGDKSSGTWGPNLIAVGSMVDSNASSAIWVGSTPIEGASILTQGKQGLDLGSCITNIPAQKLQFLFKNLINPSQFNDGIPDILITQMAQPDNNVDKIYFTDDTGKIIGNSIDINFTSIPTLGTWKIDFFYQDATVFQANTERDMRLWAAEIKDFGIDSVNYTKAKNLVYELKGSSDPAFLAYNSSVVSLLKANNDQFNAPKNHMDSCNIIGNDLPQDGTILPKNITITSAPTHGTASIDPQTGMLIYTPNTDYIGTDQITYKITATIGNKIVTSSAIVSINVDTYITTPAFDKNDTLNFCQPYEDNTTNTYTAYSDYSTNMTFQLEPETAGTLSTITSENHNYTTTITWSKSFSGTASLTATAEGSDGPKSAKIDITVEPHPLLTLTSATGTDNQSLTATNTFKDITYSVANASNVTFTNNIKASIDGNYDATNNKYSITNLKTDLGDYTYSLTAIPLSTSPHCSNYIANGTLKILEFALPVTWLYAKATAINNNILIEWSTASELNTKSFTIECKAENDKEYQSIKTVDAAGNSTSALTYQYTDNSKTEGTYLYRIKQTDLDGKYSYSKTFSVQVNGKNEESISIYPNPARDQAFIKAPENTTISIFNTEGKKMTTSIHYTSNEYQINTKGFTPGIYFIKLKTNNTTHHLKLIVVH